LTKILISFSINKNQKFALNFDCRFDQVGIYVVMFLEILQTLVKVLLVFSILIIAFGLALFILLSRVSAVIILVTLNIERV
jgi:hypothetical protein